MFYVILSLDEFIDKINIKQALKCDKKSFILLSIKQSLNRRNKRITVVIIVSIVQIIVVWTTITTKHTNIEAKMDKN